MADDSPFAALPESAADIKTAHNKFNGIDGEILVTQNVVDGLFARKSDKRVTLQGLLKANISAAETQVGQQSEQIKMIGWGRIHRRHGQRGVSCHCEV